MVAVKGTHQKPKWKLPWNACSISTNIPKSWVYRAIEAERPGRNKQMKRICPFEVPVKKSSFLPKLFVWEDQNSLFIDIPLEISWLVW